jgi:hypothetical protein
MPFIVQAGPYWLTAASGGAFGLSKVRSDAATFGSRALARFAMEAAVLPEEMRLATLLMIDTQTNKIAGTFRSDVI